MYEDQTGERLSVVAVPMAANLHAAEFDMAQNAVNGCGWIDQGVGYAIVEALPESELDRVADHRSSCHRYTVKVWGRHMDHSSFFQAINVFTIAPDCSNQRTLY